ncbi:hypothetical protein GJ654_18670 [Rhodoblastus acidophilus]|uniref:Histidine kinase n=1 Tax=Rhodoblastus acidophilus TaxID=1074 RepID=A0A6N8DRH1_RHOAC|nr:hypothetical protein [Rhodoblastus acidophilus]MCW2276352.1 hypothetical protein [Rhodoblastus acidophilus]MTV33007.1 hypothetical protein [Rhodoblastus acidophilus]
MTHLIDACTPSAVELGRRINTLIGRRLQIIAALQTDNVEHALAACTDYADAMTDLIDESMKLALLIEAAFEARSANPSLQTEQGA